VSGPVGIGCLEDCDGVGVAYLFVIKRVENQWPASIS
jgi:hypothetical protein